MINIDCRKEIVTVDPYKPTPVPAVTFERVFHRKVGEIFFLKLQNLWV